VAEEKRRWRPEAYSTVVSSYPEPPTEPSTLTKRPLGSFRTGFPCGEVESGSHPGPSDSVDGAYGGPGLDSILSAMSSPACIMVRYSKMRADSRITKVFVSIAIRECFSRPLVSAASLLYTESPRRLAPLSSRLQSVEHALHHHGGDGSLRTA
jgi:hypothetical protein